MHRILLEDSGHEIKVGLLQNVYLKKGSSLYIKGLDPSVDETALLRAFENFGLITSVCIASEEDGKSRGFGFISFLEPENADRAVVAMNGAVIAGRRVTITFAQKKFDREAFIVAKNCGYIVLGGLSPAPGTYFKPTLQQRLKLAREGKNVALVLLEQNGGFEFRTQARNTGTVPKEISPAKRAPNALNPKNHLHKENMAIVELGSKVAGMSVVYKDSDQLKRLIRNNLEQNFPKYLEFLTEKFALYDKETLEIFANDSKTLFEAAFAEITQMNRAPAITQ